MKHYKWLMGCVLLALAQLAAATTYTFTGKPYGSATGVFTTSMHIGGSFTTAAPLPVNMAETQIGPGAANLVTSWTFSDGVNTFDSSTSLSLNGDPDYFSVGTNAQGDISSFYMGFMSPTGPHTVGQAMNSIVFSSYSGDGAAVGLVCGVLANGNCSGLITDINSPNNFASNTESGSWVTQAAPTTQAAPVPATSNLLLVLMALGIGWLAWRQTRHMG